MENLGIDLKLIVAQIISIFAFYLIFRKFIANPLMKYLQKQKEDEELREKMSDELEKRNKVIEEKDHKMDLERKKALETAISTGKKEADTVKQQLIADTKSQVDSMLKQAKEQIEDQRSAMYKEVRKSIGQVSMLLVENALKAYLSPDGQKMVTKNIIEKLPKVNIEN